MKQRTIMKLDEIENGHDWCNGRTWSHGGTAYSCTDVCRYCGLVRKYFSDSQNGIDANYTFFIDGEKISLCNVPASC
jgi:hypothetical protein